MDAKKESFSASRAVQKNFTHTLLEGEMLAKLFSLLSEYAFFAFAPSTFSLKSLASRPQRPYEVSP